MSGCYDDDDDDDDDDGGGGDDDDDDDDDDGNDHSIPFAPTAFFIVSIAQGQRSWENVLRQCIPTSPYLTGQV